MPKYLYLIDKQLDQPSLGMPSREYYLKPDKDEKGKEAYLKYMVNVAQILGAEKTFAEEEMKRVLEFETDLANVSILIFF